MGRYSQERNPKILALGRLLRAAITREFFVWPSKLEGADGGARVHGRFQLPLSLPRSLTKGSESASMQMSWRESWRSIVRNEHTPFSVQLDPSTKRQNHDRRGRATLARGLNFSPRNR